jgi:hypothetical protein
MAGGGARLAHAALPAPAERERIVELGLKGGQGTLARAAAQAGVPLREMIPLSFGRSRRLRSGEGACHGAFRRDLFHRLDVVRIELRPLRERREDVPLLVEHFLSQPEGLPGRIEPEALARLSAYDFPGNVRELEHLIERARLLPT